MAKPISFKDYTRIRDIVVKRNKRAVEAGLMSPVHFPTVKEIKAGFADARQAWRSVQNYYSSGSQVKTIRQTGIKPPEVSFPVMPIEDVTEEVKRERRRRQQRDYRRRAKIDKNANLTEAQKISYKRFLKSLQTLKAKGFKMNLDPDTMSPTEALAFAEYMEYRFSQGDFSVKYVIDEFVEQYDRLKEKGYTTKQIEKDFDSYLLNRKGLTSRENDMLGLTPDEINSLMDDFIDERDFF